LIEIIDLKFTKYNTTFDDCLKMVEKGGSFGGDWGDPGEVRVTRKVIE